EAVVFAVGIGVGGDYAGVARMELGEVVLADVELYFQVVEIGHGDNVALGALVADESGGDEFALFHVALADGAGDGRANDGVIQIGLRDRHGAAGLLYLAAQRIDLLLPRAQLHQLVGFLQRVEARQGGIVFGLRIVEILLGENALTREAARAVQRDP